MTDLLLVNARITTFDRQTPLAQALAIRDGRFLAVGSQSHVRAAAARDAQVIDCGGRRAIPGLIDSHTHFIRTGLSYTTELRWDGISTLSEAMRRLKAQAARTPAPHWVRVTGGFTRHQFAEKRLPTINEINCAAPETPVYIQHLQDRALLNAAALRAVGYDQDTPNPPGGEIQRDRDGTPTGLLVARPNPAILDATLARSPQLSGEDQKTSTRHFMRDLNRLGVTSVIDAGGIGQSYPRDYNVIRDLHAQGLLSLRVACILSPQTPRGEAAELIRWSATDAPDQGDDLLRLNGAGDILVHSALDFEDFSCARPELPHTMEAELAVVLRALVSRRWPFRLHATYEETITRILDVIEAVAREIPLDGLHWSLAHTETISQRSIERVAALGGGITIQHRMAFQGEDFLDRYGARAAGATPPIRRMLDAGVPVGAGSDGSRVASCNPWTALSWLVSGRTVGGSVVTPARNRLTRTEALRLWTEGSARFSCETGRKGQIKAGQLADLALLSADYFGVPEAEISGITSVLTLLSGTPVHASGAFAGLAPPPLPAPPDWSPLRHSAAAEAAPQRSRAL
ncbi:amidohydrolase [Pseudooceanicola spongiae]|uniref:Amidohydrolase family protein n=1 Tax=Pseudooceanicola spongiae TaxID=2613965 RepID=A0A7L9WJV5_9RHOB|nr:amidohydrolase [Pseudooceanicola spongiae]QOL79646.1 amidohydrolase family protein [Pseudooceanicola spongiae]